MCRWLPEELRPALSRAHPAAWCGDGEDALEGEEEEADPFLTPADARRLMLPACDMPPHSMF